MSKLGNLFGGGGNSDSNDSLKYSAPKEPKAAKAVVASTPSKAASDSFKVPVQNIAPAKAVGPSKIMASATVRLYKINPATNAYDAVDNGSQLGCVIMGSGTTFQILIYNGQKLSQATIAITASTDYSVRDLYMSLSDAMGNAWSILFDNAEVMNHCLRTIVATIAHLASHSETPIAWETFQRSMQGSDDTGEDALAVGMSAGLYLTLWELGELADYPGDIVTGRPLRQVAAPDEVIKIKMSSAEEVLPGLTTALKGYKKGDRFMLAISPKVAYRAIDANAFVDMSVRQHPGSWLLCEVEVAKIKSSEGAKDKKKDKKTAEVAAAPTASPVSQQQSQYTNSDIDYDDASSSSQQPPQGDSGGGSDLKDRMARMAKSSGGGSMVNTGGARRGSHGSNSGDHHSSDDSHQHSHDRNSGNNSANNNNNGNSHVNRNNNNSAKNQHNNFDNRNHDDNNFNRNNNNNNTNNNNSNSSNNGNNQQDYNRNSDSNYDRHRQNNNYNNDRSGDRNGDRGYNNQNSGRNNSYQQSHNSGHNSNDNEYAVALVAGQESRSYYDSGDHDHLHNRGASERKPVPAAPVVVAADTSALQQSMMIVQQSMMQLHTKLDQVGAQVSSSFSLQQQMQAQQQAVVPAVSSAAGAAFGANPYAAAQTNPYALNAMGLNPMQQQFQAQQQQQMQMLQMQQAMAQQQQQQLPFNSLFGAGNVSGGSGLRLKSEELVSSLQSIVSECEALRRDAGSSAKTSEYAEQVSALRSSVARLEEKNETLLARNEKLMTEKSALLEKQADMIQSGSNSSNKLYAMQSEVEALRRDKAALQSDVEALRQSQSDTRASERDRAQLQELTSQVINLQNEVVELRGRNQDLLLSQQQAASDAQSKLGRANDEVYSLQSKLQDALERLESAAVSAAVLSAPRAVDLDSAEVQQYVAGRVDAVVSELQERLSGAESALQAARDATAAELAVSEDLRSEAADWKAKFVALQAEWASSSATEKERADRLQSELAVLQLRIGDLKEAAAGSGAAAEGRASPEELKAVMQDIYAKACEVFGTDDPDQDAVFAPKDVAKRLRAVLKSVTSERNS